jgi:malonyl-CoA O-methyltransferase
MDLALEYLPASGGSEQQLVLLHGWGSTREVWRPMLAALRPWANVSLLNLPGLAPGCGDHYPPLEELLAAIAASCPPQAVYVGWSLGGQLATEMAVRYPERVRALVTLCSNPRFTAAGQWPGMPAGDLAGFRTSCEDRPGLALQRFDSLQVAGIETSRPVLRSLRMQRQLPAGAALVAGLDWLRDLDQRDLLTGLPQPQLHLQAAQDGLLPAALPQALESLLEQVAGARIGRIESCGHPAPLQNGPAIAAQLHSFLRQAGLAEAPREAPAQLQKEDVAESFSRAARHYDSVAQLQRDVGSHLLQQLDAHPREPADLLDLGSGTGYFYPQLQQRFPFASYTGLDLAEGMIRFSRERFGDSAAWLVADAEALPLAAESMDLVFSSLAIQWCYRPELLFAELARVLRPGGRCVFTSLGPATLRELRAAWAAVDQHQHVNEFLPADALLEAAAGVPGVRLELRSQSLRMQYQQVRELLNELKTLGAHNVNRDRPAGLTGRRALQGMLRAYEEWREDGLLPASYEVFFGTLEKL